MMEMTHSCKSKTVDVENEEAEPRKILRDPNEPTKEENPPRRSGMSTGSTTSPTALGARTVYEAEDQGPSAEGQRRYPAFQSLDLTTSMAQKEETMRLSRSW